MPCRDSARRAILEQQHSRLVGMQGRPARGKSATIQLDALPARHQVQRLAHLGEDVLAVRPEQLHAPASGRGQGLGDAVPAQTDEGGEGRQHPGVPPDSLTFEAVEGLVAPGLQAAVRAARGYRAVCPSRKRKVMKPWVGS